MRRVLIVVSFSLVSVLSVAGFASAATVSYIAGNSLWLSSVDGKTKKKLSDATPDGRHWTEQAQADNGKVVAVRREPGKIATLNSFTLFGPTGSVLQQGSLTHEPGWFQYAYPVSLDLTNSGVAVYGYSNVTVGYTAFETGTYVRTVEKPFVLQPFEVTNWQFPTLYKDRLVASQGQQVFIQATAENNPFSDDMDVGFLQVPSGYDVNRVDVSANGKVFGIELNYNTIELYPINRVPDAGQDATVGSGGCVLATQGDASHISLSQDGKSIAWEDSRGVLSAGVPDFNGSDPCQLTRAPVVLAANGKYPSIGDASLPSGGGGGGTAPVANVPANVKASGLKSGIWITVKMAKAGSITATGKVGNQLVARGNAKARKAGNVRLRLVATGAWRNRLTKLRGKALVIKVAANGKARTIRRVLR